MSNKLPTVDIKGKDYVLVKDRIIYFNEKYPGGSIETELLSKPEEERIVVRATVRVPFEENNRSWTKMFVGHSQATVGDGYINKTSALENAETSAVGRALAFMGIGVIDSIASGDEMAKAGAINTPSKSQNLGSRGDAKPKQVSGVKDPEIALKAAKDRVATLVRKIKGDPPKGTKGQIAQWYGDQVFDLTKRSLALSDTAELEEIAEQLADVEIEK